MLLKPHEKTYLFSLNADSLSAQEVEDVFAFITTLPGGETGHPKTAKGRRVAVSFFLSLIRSHENREPPPTSYAASRFIDTKPSTF